MWWQTARCEKFTFAGDFLLIFWSFLLWRKNCTLLLKHMRRLRNCLIITETVYFSIMQYDTYKMYYVCYNETKVCDDKRHTVKISYFLGRVVNFFIIFVLKKKVFCSWNLWGDYIVLCHHLLLSQCGIHNTFYMYQTTF